MIELAHRNAALGYRQRFDANATANYDALESLQAALRLPKLPRRIDCFDISTIQGSETVASMVVCEEGACARRVPESSRSSRDQDRRSGISGTQVPGRFRGDGAGRAARIASARERRPFPDLIVIDGGKGQLNAAYAALETVGCRTWWRSAWRRKRSWSSRATAIEPLALDPHGNALRLLQRIRDEAHRFAITFHRQSRKKRDLQSELDVVPGIGLRRRKTLLTAFGSLSGVRARRVKSWRASSAQGRRRGDRAFRRESVRSRTDRARARPTRPAPPRLGCSILQRTIDAAVYPTSARKSLAACLRALPHDRKDLAR
jgi:excinuclease ABC subunit C